MRLKARFGILVGLFLVSFLSWMIFNNYQKINSEYNSFGSNIPQSYPVLGIDVSHYQGKINWRQVAAIAHNEDSIQFAFVKATEGISVKDADYAFNVQEADKNNILVGAYHYFIFSESCITQADFFVDNIVKSPYTLRPVIDVEDNSDLSSKAIIDSVLKFLNRVEERLQERPIIYAYSNFYHSHFINSDIAKTEQFWIARYGNDCPLMQNDQVLCWQFSESGTVDGIDERVDLNIAKKDFLKKVRAKK